MNFIVKYRNARGVVAQEVVAAENRAAAFAQMKARGISPISVAEGGELRASAAAFGPSRGLLKGALAGLAVVVLAGAAWFFFVNGKEPIPEIKPTLKPARQIAPKPVRKPVVAQKSTVPTKIVNAPTNAAADSGLGMWLGKRVVSKKVTTNGLYVTERMVCDDGSRHSNSYAIEKEGAFKHSSDVALAQLLSVKPGSTVPPLPMLGTIKDDDFYASLKEPIVINDADSPAVKQIKEIVKAAREDMLKMLDQGKSVKEVLAEHQKLMNENAQIRSEAISELKEIIESGDLESAKNYRNAVDAELQKLGAAPMNVPITDEEKAAAHAERVERAKAYKAAQESERPPSK